MIKRFTILLFAVLITLSSAIPAYAAGNDNGAKVFSTESCDRKGPSIYCIKLQIVELPNGRFRFREITTGISDYGSTFRSVYTWTCNQPNHVDCIKTTYVARYTAADGSKNILTWMYNFEKAEYVVYNSVSIDK